MQGWSRRLQPRWCLSTRGQRRRPLRRSRRCRRQQQRWLRSIAGTVVGVSCQECSAAPLHAGIHGHIDKPLAECCRCRITLKIETLLQRRNAQALMYKLLKQQEHAAGQRTGACAVAAGCAAACSRSVISCSSACRTTKHVFRHQTCDKCNCCRHTVDLCNITQCRLICTSFFRSRLLGKTAHWKCLCHCRRLRRCLPPQRRQLQQRLQNTLTDVK